MTALVILVCVLGTALSVKSIAVLAGTAAWTRTGWWLTVLYFIAVSLRITIARNVPEYLEYGVLAALSVAFVVAGVQDEPQAEPWWWPNHRGTTRREKRQPQ